MEGHTGTICGILGLPNKQRIITCSADGSLRVWDLESGKQVGSAWNDEGSEFKGVLALAIVQSVGWSPDGRRVANGSFDGAVRVWDVGSGETILKAIETGQGNIVWAVSYSPDGKRIATGADGLQVWDANTGKLLKTLGITVACLAWASGGSLLIVGSLNKIKTFDTNTWTGIAVLDGHERLINAISLSPNERILASVSDDNTARIWNLKSNEPIGPPLRHEREVRCVSFSGKFLATGCYDHHVYTWDVSVIVKKAGLDDILSENVNAANNSVLNAGRRATQIEGVRRVPQGFFDDEFSTSHGHHTVHTAAPRQPTNPLSWAQKFMSGMLRRRDGSDVRSLPIVEVPLTAGKPRNYHARKKPSTSSSRPPKPSTTQQQSSGATQSNPPSSQQPSSIATASTTPLAVTSTVGATGTRHDITTRQAGWRTRFLL